MRNFVPSKNLFEMGAYGIYFVILTFILAIYYVIVLFMDVFKKDKKKEDTVENFDVSDMAGDSPINVRELDGGGFVVEDPRNPQSETELEELETIVIGGGESSDPDSSPSDSQEGNEADDEEEDKGTGDEDDPDGKLQEVVRTYQQELLSEDYAYLMEQPMDAESPIKRVSVDRW